jgi:hypothetical protein
MAEEKKEETVKREDGYFPKSYDPTKDKGPDRPEDDIDIGGNDTPLSAKEV